MATEPLLPKRCEVCRGFRYVSPHQAERFIAELAREFDRRARGQRVTFLSGASIEKRVKPCDCTGKQRECRCSGWQRCRASDAVYTCRVCLGARRAQLRASTTGAWRRSATYTVPGA